MRQRLCPRDAVDKPRLQGTPAARGADAGPVRHRVLVLGGVQQAGTIKESVPLRWGVVAESVFCSGAGGCCLAPPSQDLLFRGRLCRSHDQPRQSFKHGGEDGEMRLF